MINGKTFDWEDIKVDIGGLLDLEIMAINYDTERPVEEVYGRGNAARAFGNGNLVQSGSFELDPRAWLVLVIFSGTQNGIFRIPPFPITVSFANDDQVPQVDVLPSVKLSKVSTSQSQGDTEVGKRVIDFKILDPIRLDGISVM